MTHYETLGVAPDASQEEIKAAWRKAASSSHPDRNGGDSEEMKRVNKAYETLSDEERRAHYDATGTDEGQVPVETEAENALMRALQASLQQDARDCLEMTRQILANESAELAGRLMLLSKRLSIAGRYLKTVKTRGEKNLAEMVLKQQIREMELGKVNTLRAQQINARAHELLGEYVMENEAALFNSQEFFVNYTQG